ncbi:NapC/NirT family cytochrome c, partial [bacterium]|nr:NapC/NirT family cytochrome c [bacterium]
DIFAFLLTLSFSLMAYDWVKASTSQFTQDVLFYLVIGSAVLGSIFLLPHLKRVLDRLGALPLFSIFTWRGAALVAVPVFGVGMVVLTAYSVKLTEHPKFCISCHYMGEYYESWQHSSHQNVACVQCHYEPGVEAKFEGKMAGMIQLVKYLSHAYDNKPHALISNRSCMREGCHAEMDHNKQTVLFHGKIKFSHERHLSGHPRGKELNCVSCHGQMVEGQHISVAQTACLTCHFYGRGKKPVAAGNCQTCHTVPEKLVEYQGQELNHRDFLKDKKNVRCQHCHSQITQGDGTVSATRCQSCHLRRTPKIKDQETFHLTHVSKGHFDCLQCHDEIRHGDGMKPHQMMASSRCNTCHGDGRHSIQERVYAGRAVSDLDPEPDVMFKAGVACDGCHIEDKVVTVGTARYQSRASSAKQCADCHGDAEYGEMLAEWQKEVRERLSALQPKLAALGKACEGAANGSEQATTLHAAARSRLDCVTSDGSFGAHNYAYVTSLLDRAEEEIDKGLKLLNGPKPEGTGE